MEKIDLFKAFKLAIEKEEEAHVFYSHLAEQVTDPEMKALLRKFAENESYHKKAFSNMYAR